MAYCSTMALAAVVILLAREKNALVPNTASAPSSTHRFSFNRWRVTARYVPMTTRAMAVRPPLMAMPPQGMTLMQSPPTLYSRAARNTNSVPLRSFFKPQHTPCSGHRKRPRPGRGQRANMLRGTTSGSPPPHGARPRAVPTHGGAITGAPGARLLGQRAVGVPAPRGIHRRALSPFHQPGALFAAP